MASWERRAEYTAGILVEYLYTDFCESGRQLLYEHALELCAGRDRGHVEATFAQGIEQGADDLRARQVRAGLAPDGGRQAIEIDHLTLEHHYRHLRPRLMMRAGTAAPGAGTGCRAACNTRGHL